MSLFRGSTLPPADICICYCVPGNIARRAGLGHFCQKSVRLSHTLASHRFVFCAGGTRVAREKFRRPPHPSYFAPTVAQAGHPSPAHQRGLAALPPRRRPPRSPGRRSGPLARCGPAPRGRAGGRQPPRPPARGRSTTPAAVQRRTSVPPVQGGAVRWAAVEWVRRGQSRKMWCGGVRRRKKSQKMGVASAAWLIVHTFESWCAFSSCAFEFCLFVPGWLMPRPATRYIATTESLLPDTRGRLYPYEASSYAIGSGVLLQRGF